MEQEAFIKIKKVKQRYILYHLLADACMAAAIALVAGFIFRLFFDAGLFFMIALFILAFGLITAYRRLWLVTDTTIARFLDTAHPELEESSNLLLMPINDLNFLQQLQLSKVSAAIRQVPVNHKLFTRRLQISGLWLVGALVFAFLISRLHHIRLGTEQSSKIAALKNPIKEVILPQIESVAITVIPPAYTQLLPQHQSKFTLEIAEGAVTQWRIKTNVQAGKIELLFNDQQNLTLTNPGKDKLLWAAKKTIIHPGFYQVVIDGKPSDLYQIQVIKDAAPVIRIKTPKQYTYIDAGEKPQVDIRTTITDDYGVSNAIINATIAKGSGEGVKFKTQKISFPVSFNRASRNYDLQKIINLTSLGMEPGDELYFYIQATDNDAQSSRTDVYIVSIQDTAQLLSMDGILAGANIEPEYFRSERQIILDAESLIKAKDTLSVEKFKERSNDLGTDQKLLRLRYGKFLGEEAEGNIGDPRLEENGKAADPKDFGNGAKIIDAYTDKHDNSEDAQFFDPTVKAQLKATLTEMWKAELQLRLYKPVDALPFAYQALRLLKDLQQKSRSFVAKTAYNPAPLKMEKRLSGELTKIIDPFDLNDVKTPADRFADLKSAASLLQQMRQYRNLSSAEISTLQNANQQIAEKAALQPGIYLGAENAMRRILNRNTKNYKADVESIAAAIQKMLPAAQSTPQPLSPAADMGFSKAYFLKLNRLKR